MKSLGVLAWVGVLLGIALAPHGCMPFHKYMKVKRYAERVESDLKDREREVGDLNDRLQALRDQLKAAEYLIDLYKEGKLKADQFATGAREKFDELQKRLDEFAKARPGAVVAGPGRLLFKDAVLFDLGSDDIKDDGKKILSDVAAEFKDLQKMVLQVDGHTDDHRLAKEETKKRFKDNWGLSAARACAVVRFLGEHGVVEKTMQVGAYSMFRPHAVPMSDEANRTKNRRVEILFLPSKEEAPGAEAPAPPPAVEKAPPPPEKAPAPEKAPPPPEPKKE